MKRVSKKQKRVRAKTNSSSKSAQTKATVEKSLIAKALHLLLGPEHFIDQAAAERLRQHPNVARKIQPSFPYDVKIGFAGHYKSKKFQIQDRATFVPEFVANSENAWYLLKDKRSNRKPKKVFSGIIETNVALSTGLSRVLADLVRGGMVDGVRGIMLMATDSGMKLLCKRTGYLEAYLSLHPDAEGTVSTHYGLWPIDPEAHALIGRSANGKKGRKGLRTLGDCFVSILRHHRAIGLPADLVRQPEKNLAERDPDDWAVGEEMDRVVCEELSKLPNGPELLQRADRYQREAAEDWLQRYRKSKAGIDKQHAELVSAQHRINELEAALSKAEEVQAQTRTVLQFVLEMPVVEMLLRSAERVWSEIQKLAGLLGLVLHRESLQNHETNQGGLAPTEFMVEAPEVENSTAVNPAVSTLDPRASTTLLKGGGLRTSSKSASTKKTSPTKGGPSTDIS